MRIAIHNITSGGMSSGYKKFLGNVIPRLSAHPSVSCLFITIPEDINLKIKHSYSNVSWYPYSQNWLSRAVNQAVCKALEGFDPDVIFIPTARMFKFREIPVITMLQNMEPIVYRGSNPLQERIINWIRAKDACRSLKSSTRIIAVSKFVKESLIKKLNVTPDKISMVYFGTNDMNGKNKERPESVPAEWDGRFLFTAGSIRPSRGLEVLLRAFSALKERNGISGLVIAGETPPRMGHYYSRLNELIRKYSLDNRVYFTGLIDREEMIWCYKNCYAFVMTSRVEACPNIALEAMSNGCICISDDNKPLPEIFGESAVYYPSKSWKILADTIYKVSEWDSSKRKKESVNAIERASQFSWDICADRLVSEMKKAIELE